MGWDRWGDDWGSSTITGRRRRRPAPAHFERVTFQEGLTRSMAERPEVVDKVRERLSYAAEHWCETHGYLATGATWETVPADEFSTVIFRLTAEIAPRTDGEWPAIHEAIRQDQLDRERATAAKEGVSDRLDALAAAASYWADPEYRRLPPGA
jgi:hypothetical protein